VDLNLTFLYETVITMFILVMVGYIFAKAGFLPASFTKKLSDLVCCVAQPFMIVGAILSIPYSAEDLKTGGLILRLGLFLHGAAAVVAVLATFKFKDVGERRISEYACIFANCGFMGLPVLEALFGNVGRFWGAFYIIAFNCIAWTYGLYILSKANPVIKMNPKKILLNYGTVPSIIGLALYLARISLPAPILSATNYMGSLCTPLSMVITGALLARLPLKSVFLRPKVYYISAIKLLFLPAAVLALTTLLQFPTDLRIFSVTIVSLPVAANSAMFGESYDIQPEYAASLVGLSTLLSVATIPLVLNVVKLL